MTSPQPRFTVVLRTRRMRDTGRSLAAGVICALLLIPGCGGDGDDGDDGIRIGPDGGIVISHDGKASLEVGPGTVGARTAFAVERYSSPPAGNIGAAYEFKPEGVTFAQPVTVSIIFDEASIPGDSFKSDLRLAILVNGIWEQVPDSTLDFIANSVAGEVTVLGIYGVMAVRAPASAMKIEEFRVRGPGGANDEYIQVTNSSEFSHVVTASSGTGYAIAASDGVVRCSLPDGTVIPSRGHFLCVNSVAYSLASYPAGGGATATGDATFTTGIADNAGIALFDNNSGGASFSLASRLDAVGSNSEANMLYREGTGYPALTPFSIDHAWVRDLCGKGGSISAAGSCPAVGALADTGSNAADLVFVDTNGTSAGGGQRLGAPGPQNLGSPAMGSAPIGGAVIDSCVADAAAPNLVRNFTSDPANNSTFGTIEVRRTFTNTTGTDITRLRFRVIDLTTFPAPSGIADLRPRTSAQIVVTVDGAPCGAESSDITVHGTTLEQPPSQANGGGFNSSWSAGSVSLATPLASGASISVRFLMGIQQTGNFRLGIILEAAPTGGAVFEIAGATG